MAAIKAGAEYINMNIATDIKLPKLEDALRIYQAASAACDEPLKQSASALLGAFLMTEVSVSYPDDESRRGTGRTIGLMLKAIGESLLRPCEWVEFVDHAPTTVNRAATFAEMIRKRCGSVHLEHMTVVQREHQVFVMSHPPRREAGVSDMHPCLPPLPRGSK